LVKIYIGDNSTQETIGKGNTEIVMIVGDIAIEGVLTDVLNVPGITKKLFSISKATSLNHVFEFNKNIVVVRNNQKKVIRGVKDNRLYKSHCNTKLSTTENIEHITISQETNNINLWHQRFKHLNANSLKILSKKKLINSKTKLSFCKSYVQGKQHKATFPKEGNL